MLFAKWRPFCLSPYVLNTCLYPWLLPKPLFCYHMWYSKYHSTPQLTFSFLLCKVLKDILTFVTEWNIFFSDIWQQLSKQLKSFDSNFVKLLKDGFEFTTYYDIFFSDIRQQLNEQLKCLDARLESHMAMLGELQEFYRQRAEVELNYSKALDRLVKQIMQRHKVEKTR